MGGNGGQMKFRITVRGDECELRGYIVVGDDTAGLDKLAEAVKPFGIVIASLAKDDYNPFTPEFGKGDG
jgi:hypothetical protein